MMKAARKKENAFEKPYIKRKEPNTPEIQKSGDYKECPNAPVKKRRSVSIETRDPGNTKRQLFGEEEREEVADIQFRLCDCKESDTINTRLSTEQISGDCAVLVYSTILPSDDSKTRHEKCHEIVVEFATKDIADGMFFHSQCLHNDGRLYAFFELKDGEKWEKIKTNVN